MWAISLSARLPVEALVSRYLTNKLIGHEPLLERQVPKDPHLYPLPDARMRGYSALLAVSRRYS